MKTSTKTIEHYNVGTNDIALPASTSKRFFARILDMFMAVFAGKVMLSIFYGVSTPKITESSVLNGFEQFVPQAFSATWIIGMILVILGILTIFFILPMMSKKRFGQTLGKKALNITPLYLSSENKYASYLKRELPIMGIYMIPVVLTLFIGNDPTFVYSQYTKFLSEVGVNNSLRPNNAYDFYMNHWTDASKVGGASISSGAASVAYTKEVLRTVFVIIVFIIWISIIFNPKKQGIHDKFAKVAIIDLFTMKNKTEYFETINSEESEDTPITEVESQGPPVEIKTTKIEKDPIIKPKGHYETQKPSKEYDTSEENNKE